MKATATAAAAALTLGGFSLAVISPATATAVPEEPAATGISQEVGAFLYTKVDKEKPAAWENSGLQRLIITEDGTDWITTEAIVRAILKKDPKVDLCADGWAIQQDKLDIDTASDFTWPETLIYPDGFEEGAVLTADKHEDLDTSQVPGCETPTPSPTPTPTPTAPPTTPPADPTPSPSPTPTPEPSVPPTPEPSPTPTPDPTPSPTPSPSPTPTPDPSVPPTPDPTPTPSPTPTPDPTPTPSPTPDPSVPPAPEPSPTPDPMPTPDPTPTPTPDPTPSPTPEATPPAVVVPQPTPKPTPPAAVTPKPKATPPAAVTPEQLPETGANPTMAALAGAGVLAAGLGTVALVRNRRRSDSSKA